MSTENNNIAAVDTYTGELIENVSASPIVPDSFSHLSVSDFRADAMTGRMSRLARNAHEKGHSTAVLQAGDQLTTDEVVGKVWTIIAASYAHVPDDKDPTGMSQKMYPCCVFAEAPSHWYNLGQIASEMVADWAAEMGDDINESPNLPGVNAELAACGGVRIFMRWKQGKDRRYISVTVA